MKVWAIHCFGHLDSLWTVHSKAEARLRWLQSQKTRAVGNPHLERVQVDPAGLRTLAKEVHP